MALEDALEDALKGTRFDDVDKMLLRSYYLYQKAPKKLRQLRELFEIYRGATDYLSDNCKPKKASGTRWISHKLGAMKTVLDKWGLYIQHLENLTEDKSLKAKDRAKMKGYLRKWSKADMPLLLALFIDLLETPSILSRSFQDDKIDTVQAMRSLSKAKERLDIFDKRSFEKLHVNDLLKRISVDGDGKYSYQNVILPDFENAKERISAKKNDLSRKVRECITASGIYGSIQHCRRNCR